MNMKTWSRFVDSEYSWTSYRETNFQDFPGELQRIAAHINIEITEQDIAKITEETTFKKMKESKSVSSALMRKGSLYSFSINNYCNIFLIQTNRLNFVLMSSSINLLILSFFIVCTLIIVIIVACIDCVIDDNMFSPFTHYKTIFQV